MEVQFFPILCAILAIGIVGNATGDGEINQKVGQSSLTVRTLMPFEVMTRKRRMSCDALSFPLPYGYMNHAACASYCIATWQNVRGYCQHGICKCK